MGRMDRNNNKISSIQLAAIISITTIGVGVLSLPRTMTQKAGPDGWIVIIMAAFLLLILGLIIGSLVQRFPQKTIVELSNTLVGKPIGGMISLFFCIYLIIFSAAELRIFGELAKIYLLINTPIEVLMITLLFAAVYLVRSGIESIARFSQVAFPIAIGTFILLAIPVLIELDFSYFLPIFRTPILDMVKALPIALFSFSGIELMLLFGAFVVDPKNMKRSVFITVGLIFFIYLFIYMISVARFGIRGVTHIIWPGLELFKTVSLPGAFIENLQIYVVSIWILLIFMTFVPAYFGASLTLTHLVKSKEQNYFVLPLLPIIYYIALIPDNIAQVSRYLYTFFAYGGMLYIAVIPLLLWIVGHFKNGKGGQKNV
jgi:spore germination protein